jgi:hypothetical protein
VDARDATPRARRADAVDANAVDADVALARARDAIAARVVVVVVVVARGPKRQGSNQGPPDLPGGCRVGEWASTDEIVPHVAHATADRPVALTDSN